MSSTGKELVEPTDTTESSKTQTLPDRTMNPASEGDAPPAGEMSKNALKKAAKKEKMAAEKAAKGGKSGKPADKGIGHGEAKKAPKPSKKKIDGAALIGIDVAKEDDFASWYQQVLLKGDMLDYYDVSGCFVLKVGKHSYSFPRFLHVTDKCMIAPFILYMGRDSKLV